MATLVERTSRFTILVKLPGNDTTCVVNAIAQQNYRTSKSIKKIAHLGSRDGVGKAQKIHHRHGHQSIFCDPQSPWQRGTNENTNRLLAEKDRSKCSLSI